MPSRIWKRVEARDCPPRPELAEKGAGANHPPQHVTGSSTPYYIPLIKPLCYRIVPGRANWTGVDLLLGTPETRLHGTLLFRVCLETGLTVREGAAPFEATGDGTWTRIGFPGILHSDNQRFLLTIQLDGSAEQREVGVFELPARASLAASGWRILTSSARSANVLCRLQFEEHVSIDPARLAVAEGQLQEGGDPIHDARQPASASVSRSIADQLFEDFRVFLGETKGIIANRFTSYIKSKINPQSGIEIHRVAETSEFFRFLWYAIGDDVRLINYADWVLSIRTPRVVVDYGCGLAYDSYLVCQRVPGVKVYLFDLDAFYLDFVEWRFRRAGFDVNVIRVSEANPYPELPNHDLCLANEVFEHVDDPLRLLQNIAHSQEAGSVLLANLDDHEPGGGHVSPDLADVRREAGEYFLNTDNRLIRIRKPDSSSLVHAS